VLKIKSHRTVEQIAKKHRVEVSFVKNQLEMGIPIEHEHTRDKVLATDIALQHLDEIPDYYTRLKKMEASAIKNHKKFKDVKEHCGCEDDAVEELEHQLKTLKDTSYDSIDKLMRRVMKKHDLTAKQLHNAFVNKNGKTPDDWVEDLKEGTLHHWFKGSKSKSGKPGWVQADGSPCANEPGETKTPKCFSSGRLKSLKAKGEKGEALIRSAIRRKRQEDKGQQQKSGAAKPTNVPTFAKGKKDKNYVKAEPGIKESMELNEAQKDKPGKSSGKKDACYHKVKSRYDVWPSAYASGALVKCRKVGASNWGTKSEAVNPAQQAAIAINMKKKGIKPKSEMKEEFGVRYCPKCQKNETRDECKYGPKFWEMFSAPPVLTSNQIKYDPNRPHPANEEKDHEYSMARSELSTIISAAKRLKKKMKGEGNIEAWVQSKITKAADYIDTAADYLESGEHKVDESVTVQDSTGNDYVEFINIIKPEPLQPSKGLGNKLSVREETFSNWREELEQLDENPLVGLGVRAGLAAGTALAGKMVFDKAKGVADKIEKQNIEKEKQIKQILGNSHELEGEQLDEKCWKGYEKKGMKTMFGKRYPNCIKKEEFSDWRNDLGEDWQSVNRKDKTDGLSQAAVDAYRRENPGSKLQTAVTEKKPKGKRAKRRANFCRRMKGMKSKLTSAKTARDPDSRINKALRRWNCN
jgi:hypothetical protein